MPEKKRKKKNGGNIFAAVILILCCLGLGYLMGSMDFFPQTDEGGAIDYLLLLFVQLILFFLAYYLQIILHEGGHLIAGLMTGYRFSSFRIGSIMLLKNHEGYSIRKFSLAGTGGQCLLIPPDKDAEGRYPYKLYHLGGVLLNLITALLFLAVFLFCSRECRFLWYLALAGVICGATNGIPMRISGIATDGYNVIHIGKEPFALNAMWLQLKINEAQTEGIRLKDLPEEWFEIPDSAAKNNEIISTIAVFAENRAMDALDFQKAKEIISVLKNDEEYRIIGLYQNLLQLDMATIELLENGENADISGVNTRQMKAFRNSMAKYPAVLRAEYAIRLLKDKDAGAAIQIKKTFEKVARKYPMSSDIDSETEIMEYLDSYAENGMDR